MTAQTEYPTWAAPVGSHLRAEVPLAPLTTLRIGGPAEWYYPAETKAELITAFRVARAASIPVTLLGDGSNVLISDRGIRGLVIHNQARCIERRGERLYSDSGAHLSTLVERSHTEVLTGLEFAAGIYGTVGGAVFGNAGAYGRSMADILAEVEILTSDGVVRSVAPTDMEFAYRHSGCEAHGWVVLSCTVRLGAGNADQIRREIERILALRAAKLPTDLPSAGSYFKNLEDPRAEFGKVPAGKLLDEVGAKSFRVGDAAVFPRHANVIVNLGSATAADVLALAALMRVRVRERFGIELVNEVRFLGEPMS